MDKEILEIDKFNIISDEENYYFFRALNMDDNSDIEEKTTVSSDGKIERIRTDRERYEEKTKYAEESKISLEEVYDHIKIHYRKDTNCISLTSNANIAINYGRGSYKDKYVMIKIPKREFGEQTVEAGQYMLQELYSKIEKTVEELPEETKSEILEIFSDIDVTNETKELKEIIEKRYTAKSEEVNPSKAHLRKGITYSSTKARISSYQALNEEQLLEVNKVYAKLAVLENRDILKHVIPHSSNSKLRNTIGNAFSAIELIHYGEIKQNEIIEVPKETIDLFALIQQIDGIDKNKVEEIKKALIVAIQNGKEIPQIPEIESSIKDNISIEEMYQLTGGTVEYGKANSIVKNMFYLSKARQNAIKLSETLSQVLGNDSKFDDVIEYIKDNGFRIEPEIISRQSGKGVKLSESVNLNLSKDEQILVDEIKKLSSEELENILQNGGFTNDVISKVYGNQNKQIDKSRYYAEAIISQYDWSQIGIEEFKISERNELIKRLQDRNCVDIYEKLMQTGIEAKQIPTILLNIATRQGFYEEYEKGNLEQLLNTRQDVLQDNINIELVEKFLGYYDVENTEIRLKDYQQRAYDNVNNIFEDHKFAQVILPTGAGKSFVALAQMQKYAQEHPEEKMLYLAPQDEIINQIKNYIIKYVHGKQDTVGKTEDEIIAEVFPNITFETYRGLIAKRGQKVIKEQYGMMILDELHRTGAKEWEGKIDELLDNQNEDVKVLGITATPVRDTDGRDMSEENAKKLGYTDEEVKQRKYLASNMTLENAIRMGYVVNPKLVYCKYDLISSGKMDELRAKIDDIEDEAKRTEELQKYNELSSKLNREIDAEIGKEARKQLEEEARKNLDNGIGKEEILRQNVKKGGKYIVFIPVTDQGEIEDEDGNRIGIKTGEDKIKAYQEYLDKVFSGTEIVPQLHSLLGSYSEDKNKEELEAFETDSTDETKFMVVMNKANEGLHIDGVDGIIWFRALDENSRILYLQQLGRAIYALDEDNPLSDDKRPVVIDLANNSLTVKIEKEFKNSEPIDDLESLKIIIEWINEHDGMIPNRESSNKQEQHYYAVLRSIQSKYSKYLDGFEEYSELDEKEKIQEIVELASEIDLWDMELPPIPKTRGSKDEFDPFMIEGILRDYVEFEDEINEIDKLTSFEKILKFAEENGRIPQSQSHKRRASEITEKEREEDRLYNIWRKTEEKKIVDRYIGKKLEDIPEKDREIVELIKNYGYGLTYFEKVLKFAGENGRIPQAKSHKRRVSEVTEKEREEDNLYKKWANLKEKKIVDRYIGKKLEDIPEEDRKLVELIRNYGYGLTNFEEIIKFAEENGRIPKEIRKKTSERTEKEKEENSLYSKWIGTEERKIVDRYIGKKLEEIPEEDRELVELIRKYGYGLTNFEKILKFAEENGRIPQYQLNKKSTSERKKIEEEASLYNKWGQTKEKKTVDKYIGKKLEEVPEEDRALVKLIRNYGYGLTHFEEILKFAEENGRIPNSIRNELAKRTEKERKEAKLYDKWIRTKEKKTVDKYIEKKLEEIPKEDRRLVELIRNYGYGLNDFEEILKFAKENGRIPKRVKNELSEKEKEESSLARKWYKTKERKIVDRYFGKKLEDIPEEDRELVETIRNYGYLGKKQSELTPFEEVIKFAEENGRIPNKIKKELSERTEKEKEENSLYRKWIETKEKKIVDRYAGKKLEEISEENRELVQMIRNYGYGLQSGLTSFEEVIKFAEENGRIPKQSKEKASDRTEKEKEEDNLYKKWFRTDEKKIVDRYVGIDLEEIPEQHRELVQTIRNYGYGLTYFDKVLKFAEENGKIPKKINKKVSERTEKESEEDSLYDKWRKSEEKKIVDRYAGMKIEEIPEEHRKLVQTIRNYGYGLTYFDKVLKFAEENGKIPNKINKKVSERTEKESEEDSLYEKWRKSEEKKIVDRYAGMKLEEIPEEHRKLVQTIRNYGYLGKVIKAQQIGKATYMANVEECDQAQSVLDESVKKELNKGEVTQNGE